MADPNTWTTLNIEQQQILYDRQHEDGLAGPFRLGAQYEHTILCFRLPNAPAQHLSIIPDGESEVIDLSWGNFLPLEPNARFPADRIANGDFVAYHGTVNTFREELQEVRARAVAMGCDVSQTAAGKLGWIVYEAGSPLLGQLIDVDLLPPADVHLGATKGSVIYNGQELFVKRIDPGNVLEEIKPLQTVAGKRDFRLLYDIDPTVDPQPVIFSQVRQNAQASPIVKHWGLDEKKKGPRMGQQYTEGVIEVARSPVEFSSTYNKDVDMPQYSRAMHESNFLCDLQQTMVVKDGYHPYNSYTYEKVCRRLRYIQRSQVVARPTDAKSAAYTDTSKDEKFGIKTPDFDVWAIAFEKEATKAKKVELEAAQQKADAAKAAAEKAKAKAKGGGKGGSGGAADDSGDGPT